MKAAGFTLLEVLIALIITAAAAVLLSTAWSGNLMRVRKTTLYSNVAQLLQRKVAEINAENSKKSFDEIAEEDKQGDFGSQYPQYSWSFKTQRLALPDIGAILQSQQKGSANQMLLTMLSKMRQIMGQAILEAKVTVYVKVQNHKKMPFSVTYYIVNYNAPINIGL